MIPRLRRLLQSRFRVLSSEQGAGGGVVADARRAQTAFANGINLLRPDVLLNPYPHYAAMRRAGSVHFLTEHGFWLVLGYDDVVHALKHPELFSSARPTVRFDPVLNEADPPAHTRVRRVLSPHFSSRSAQALGEYAGVCAVELLAKGDAAAEFDLVEDFADPLTEMSMGRVLGLAPDETEDLRRRLSPHKRRSDGEMYRVLEEWLRMHLSSAREGSGDSLGGQLLRGEGEAALQPEETVGVLKLLWVAGTTTTSRLISASALLLLQHPHARAELRDDPSLLPAFVEEAVRMEASEQMVWRVTREDVELSGVRIPEGEEVRLCVAAANRDPLHFSEPDTLSLRRNPNNHLSFAAGPHYCIGAAAGRAVARSALDVLLTRWPDFAASRPLSEISYEESFSSRALEHLFVAWSGR